MSLKRPSCLPTGLPRRYPAQTLSALARRTRGSPTQAGDHQREMANRTVPLNVSQH